MKVADRESLESLPTDTLGQYRVVARIGSGGMGDVFDAVHISLDKRVAIKTLRRRYLDDPTVVARFLREGQLASRIRHPNIVDVTDVGVMDGLPCLVMELLEGETLSQTIRRDGALTLDSLVDALLPIIAAVDFAHDHGVLHRDLKPSNIFLTRSWNGEVHPKVLDFGISKLVHEPTEAALTTDSAFVGTPHYASPESVRADKPVDGRADQYSMGVILYEGATGVRPFASKGGSFVTMAMAICDGDFPSPRSHNANLSEAFERVILRAMALRVDDRFLGMRHLGTALLPFATERARLIWTPTFGGATAAPGAPGPLARSQAQVTSRGELPAAAGSSATEVGPPGGPTAGLPPSGPIQDSTPSFGDGTNRSIPAPTSRTFSWSRAIVAAAVGLPLLFVLGFVASWWSKASVVSGLSVPPEVSAATTFSIDVRCIPESATIELDGVPVGAERLTRVFNQDGQKHELRVSAPIHEAVVIAFDSANPPPNVIALPASIVRAVPSASAGRKPPPIATGRPPGAVLSTGTSVGRPSGSVKAKPDRPRTDNIDPWE